RVNVLRQSAVASDFRSAVTMSQAVETRASAASATSANEAVRERRGWISISAVLLRPVYAGSPGSVPERPGRRARRPDAHSRRVRTIIAPHPFNSVAEDHVRTKISPAWLPGRAA